MSQVSLQSLFRAIDLDSNGFLTINEFAQAINKANKTFHWEFLRRMIKQYDKFGEFSLNLQDFKAFLGFNGKPNEETESEKEVNETNFELFIGLVLKEIETSRKLSEMADDIKKTKEFITYEAFRSIAGFDKYITETNLNAYLAAKGIEVKDKRELTKIIFRYDRNMDGFFGYNEFKDIFSPYSSNNTQAMYSPKKEANDIPKSSFAPLMKSKPIQNPHINCNNDSNAQTNNFSQMSKIDRLIYDYSFDEKISNDNQIEKPMIIMPIKDSNLSPLANPFIKSINRDLSLTGKPEYSISPLKFNEHYSKNDIPASNSMLNNSFINMPLSHNASQGYNSPNLIKKIKENQQKLFQSYSQQSPCQDNNNKRNIIIDTHDYISQKLISINENKQYLIEYLNEIIIQELICETAKEELSKAYNIHPHDLFYFFDNSDFSKISISDLNESLKKLSIMITSTELKLLFNRYDNDKDDYLK